MKLILYTLDVKVNSILLYKYIIMSIKKLYLIKAPLWWWVTRYINGYGVKKDCKNKNKIKKQL